MFEKQLPVEQTKTTAIGQNMSLSNFSLNDMKPTSKTDTASQYLPSMAGLGEALKCDQSDWRCISKATGGQLLAEANGQKTTDANPLAGRKYNVNPDGTVVFVPTKS